MSSVECRRCGTSLEEVAEEPLGRHWFDDVALAEKSYVGTRCPRCSWSNVRRFERFYETDVAALAARLTVHGLDLSDSDDEATILYQLRILRSAAAGAVRALVLDHPDWSCFWLLAMVRAIEGTRSTDEANMVLGLQQVYASLLTRGPIAPPNTGAGVPGDAFALSLETLVAATQRLSAILREAASSLTASASMRSGVLHLVPSDDMLWTLETNLSRFDDGDRPYKREFSEAVNAVERQTFGASAVDVLAVAHALPAEPIVQVDLETLADSVARQLVLSADRWRSHAVPSFLSADPRAGSPTDQAMVIKAAEVDWLGIQSRAGRLGR